MPRDSCPVSSVQSGTINSRYNEIIAIHPETEILVQHKVDIDANEDRCINAVRVLHQPLRGCRYDLLFTAVPGKHLLQLTRVELEADSWCPGWRDLRETGEEFSHRSYTMSPGSVGISLALSRSHVPDRTADRSCTELAMSTQGDVFLSRGFGGRPERFLFNDLRFNGQFDSVGEPSSICPSPPPVERVVEPKEPVENPFRNSTLLVYLGHESIPNFPIIDGGVAWIQSIGDRFALRGDISFGPLKHSAINANVMLGTVSNRPGLRPYLGLRSGGIKDGSDSTSARGLNLGLETNRNATSSPLYVSFELTPVWLGEELRAYMSSDPTLYTHGGVLAKLHVGVALR